MSLRITGKVTEGNKIGRELGFPTANIVVAEDFKARDGVYAVWVRLGSERYSGMANLGRRPSVKGGGANRLLEINLFGFEGDLYDREISVELLEFIRPEEKFDSLDGLKRAVESDRRRILDYFKNL